MHNLDTINSTMVVLKCYHGYPSSIKIIHMDIFHLKNFQIVLPYNAKFW